MTDLLSGISHTWSASKYLWRKLEDSWFLIIYALLDLKKIWCGISFILKCLFPEYMIGSWEWCLRYYMPCLKERKAGYDGSLIYPMERMVRYQGSLRVWEMMFTRTPTLWLRENPCEFSISISYSPIRGI